MRAALRYARYARRAFCALMLRAARARRATRDHVTRTRALVMRHASPIRRCYYAAATSAFV